MILQWYSPNSTAVWGLFLQVWYLWIPSWTLLGRKNHVFFHRSNPGAEPTDGAAATVAAASATWHIKQGDVNKGFRTGRECLKKLGIAYHMSETWDITYHIWKIGNYHDLPSVGIYQSVQSFLGRFTKICVGGFIINCDFFCANVGTFWNVKRWDRWFFRWTHSHKDAWPWSGSILGIC